MTEIIENLWICVDCYVAIANADFSGMDGETARAVRSGLENGGLWALISDGENSDPFSMSPCDCCKSHLGGERFKATLAL